MAMTDSIANAVATSGSAIVFAGGTVVIALLSLAVAGIPLVTALGIASAIGVVAAVLGSISLLPAFLGLLKHRIRWASLPDVSSRRRTCRGRACGTAGRASYAVIRSIISVVSLAFLAPMVIPVFSLELGQEDIGATNVAHDGAQGLRPDHGRVRGRASTARFRSPRSCSRRRPRVPAYTKKYDKATSLQKQLDQGAEGAAQAAEAARAAAEAAPGAAGDADPAGQRAQGAAGLADRAGRPAEGPAGLAGAAGRSAPAAEGCSCRPSSASSRPSRPSLKRKAEALAARIKPLAVHLAALEVRERILRRQIAHAHRPEPPARAAAPPARPGAQPASRR